MISCRIWFCWRIRFGPGSVGGSGLDLVLLEDQIWTWFCWRIRFGPGLVGGSDLVKRSGLVDGSGLVEGSGLSEGSTVDVGSTSCRPVGGSGMKDFCTDVEVPWMC